MTVAKTLFPRRLSRQRPARRLAPQQRQQLRGTTGVEPEEGGNAASTTMQPTTWPGRAALMTGMNSPALLCATSTSV